METVVINNTKYQIANRTESNSVIGKDKNLKENQSLLWLVKPNGKHIYMVIETVVDGNSQFGKISKI